MGRTQATAENILFAPGSVREMPVDSVFLICFRARLLRASCVLEIYDVLARLVIDCYFALGQIVFEWS